MCEFCGSGPACVVCGRGVDGRVEQSDPCEVCGVPAAGGVKLPDGGVLCPAHAAGLAAGVGKIVAGVLMNGPRPPFIITTNGEG